MSDFRVVGADSLSPVNDLLIADAASTLGSAPNFWGRYFTSTSTKGTGEYRHRVENAILNQHQIRVLPVARQTNRVGMTHADGLRDGTANAEDLVATFGGDYLLSLGGRFRIFLDVEGNGVSHLANDYYLGWTEGLTQGSPDIEIMPCVYGIPGDTKTWNALSQALAEGSRCHGVWLSHPFNAKAEPIAWSPLMLAPYQDIPDVPVLLWQYLFGPTFDRNLVNPDLGDASDFLETLILPPPE